MIFVLLSFPVWPHTQSLLTQPVQTWQRWEGMTGIKKLSSHNTLAQIFGALEDAHKPQDHPKSPG